MLKVVIDIPDADYKSITEDYISYADTESGRVYKAIKEGTVLPDNPTNMTKEEKREWKAERKFRKALKKYLKTRPRLLEEQTHIYRRDKKYFIKIWRDKEQEEWNQLI